MRESAECREALPAGALPAWHDKLSPQLKGVLRAVRQAAGNCLDTPEMSLFEPLRESLSPDALLAVGERIHLDVRWKGMASTLQLLPMYCKTSIQMGAWWEGSHSSSSDKSLASLCIQGACWRRACWQEGAQHDAPSKNLMRGQAVLAMHSKHHKRIVAVSGMPQA